VPPHAGTQDVDIVIDLQLLTDTQAYRTLEENLHARGFERATNEKGQRLSWRWQTRTEHGALMVLELLADAPEIAGGKVQPLPTEGTIFALNIPALLDRIRSPPGDRNPGGAPRGRRRRHRARQAREPRELHLPVWRQTILDSDDKLNRTRNLTVL
jgi:hypothetical protein